MSTATISTTVDIDATPQAVWNALTNFAAYGSWNPLMDRVDGTPALGERLVVHMTLNSGRGMTFKPTVLAATRARELRWLGKVGVRGVFDGEHSFLLNPNADGTRLTHGERFSVVLVPLIKGTIGNTREGFTAFNQALKQRVENARRAALGVIAKDGQGNSGRWRAKAARIRARSLRLPSAHDRERRRHQLATGRPGTSCASPRTARSRPSPRRPTRPCPGAPVRQTHP